MMRLTTGAAALACTALLILIFLGSELNRWEFNRDSLVHFKLIFLSIILEALPFLLIGVFISALLQAYVSDKLIQRLTPRHPLAGAIFGSLLGLILPLCECGMIPIVRRLIQKGLPAYMGMVYIVAGPILNPIVVGATFAAFPMNRDLVYSRFFLAFLVSVSLGILLYKFMLNSPLKPVSIAIKSPASTHIHAHTHHESHNHSHSHSHNHSHNQRATKNRISKLAEIPGHAAEEFFDMGKYLILGSLLAALLQSQIPRDSIAAIADHLMLSQLFMMGLAYALSLCSTSDAFVAAAFSNLFPPASLLTFLVFGPMVDLKNTLMMLAVFRKRFVLKFSLLVAGLVLMGAILFDQIGFV